MGIRKVSAGTWALIAAAILCFVGGAALVRTMLDQSGVLLTPEEREKRGDLLVTDAQITPEFRVGDLAPDFTLPDINTQRRPLSQLVNRDTLLWFICGCDACKELQGYATQLMRRLGPKAPDNIALTTQEPVAAKAWIRDTGFQQHMLFEKKNGPIMEKYRGHPCPRIYRLDADRRVRWISPSLARTRHMEDMGNSLAVQLGFEPEIPSPMFPNAGKGKKPSLDQLPNSFK